MDKIRLKQFSQLEYQDPLPILLQLREVETELASSCTPSRVKQLRTNPLKTYRERREAAIFCYGIGQRIGHTVYSAWSETQDHDFVASWFVDEVQRFAPVQLKEVVPTHLNAAASVQSVVDGLAKYVDSEDLVVAIHLNRSGRFDPNNLHIPTLLIGQLWVFGAISEDQMEWGLWGDLLKTREGTRFRYPN